MAWIGKFAIITFLFFASILFASGMMSFVTGETLFNGWTGEALDQLATGNTVDVEANPTLLFGDHIATAQAVGTLLLQTGTGGVVTDVMQATWPLNNFYIMLFVRFLYTFSLSFLILSMLGRFENL